MKKRFSRKLSYASLSLAIGVSFVGAPSAFAAKTITESLQSGSSTKVNLRTRYEDVSEEGLEDSDALTLRARLSYQSGAWNGFAVFAEADDVSELTNKVDYRTAPSGDPANSGTAIIADPVGTEVNQAFLSYTTFNNQVKYGRQRIVLDNARFVGNVGWRQNEQTYDGISFTDKTIRYTNFTYAYIKNVNRIFGEANLIQGDHYHDSHIANVSYTGFEAGKIIAYAYLLENESVVALSSDTVGVRWQSATDGMFSYNLEYATQQNAGANAAFDADYLLAEGALNSSRFTFTLGYENLGSDSGLYGFATPLATLHVYQGWADKFLNTPIVGIEDKYFNTGVIFWGVQALVSYHQFDADEGDADLGNEIDLSLSKKVGATMFTIKYADYSQGDLVAIKDTTKFWVMADWNF